MPHEHSNLRFLRTDRNPGSTAHRSLDCDGFDDTGRRFNDASMLTLSRRPLWRHLIIRRHRPKVVFLLARWQIGAPIKRCAAVEKLPQLHVASSFMCLWLHQGVGMTALCPGLGPDMSAALPSWRQHETFMGVRFLDSLPPSSQPRPRGGRPARAPTGGRRYSGAESLHAKLANQRPPPPSANCFRITETIRCAICAR